MPKELEGPMEELKQLEEKEKEALKLKQEEEEEATKKRALEEEEAAQEAKRMKIEDHVSQQQEEEATE